MRRTRPQIVCSALEGAIYSGSLDMAALLLAHGAAMPTGWRPFPALTQQALSHAQARWEALSDAAAARAAARLAACLAEEEPGCSSAGAGGPSAGAWALAGALRRALRRAKATPQWASSSREAETLAVAFALRDAARVLYAAAADDAAKLLSSSGSCSGSDAEHKEAVLGVLRLVWAVALDAKAKEAAASAEAALGAARQVARSRLEWLLQLDASAPPPVAVAATGAAAAGAATAGSTGNSELQSNEEEASSLQQQQQQHNNSRTGGGGSSHTLLETTRW